MPVRSLVPGESATYSVSHEFVYRPVRLKDATHSEEEQSYFVLSKEQAQRVLEGASVEAPEGITVTNTSFTVESPVPIQEIEGIKSPILYSVPDGCWLTIWVSIQAAENCPPGEKEIKLNHPGVIKLGDSFNAYPQKLGSKRERALTDQTTISVWVFKSAAERADKTKKRDNEGKACVIAFLVIVILAIPKWRGLI